MSNILQFTGLVSAFLILCGVLKLYIYYKQFGISILRFIEIEEIVTLLFDNLLAFISVILPTTLYVYLLRSDVTVPSVGSFSDVFSFLYIKWPIVICFLMIGLIGVILFKIKNKGVNNTDLLYLIILVFCCSIFFPILFNFFYTLVKENSQSKTFVDGPYLFFVCFILLIYSILTALNEHKKVNNGNYFSGTIIFMKEGKVVLESDATVFFIGMTKNYFFIYNKPGKKCIVYKVEDIAQIEFPNKRI